MIILRRPWAQQPTGFVGVNQAESLAVGLVLAWVPSIDIDQSGYRRRSIISGAGLVRPTQNGNLGYDNNFAGAISFESLPAPPSNALTLLRVFTFTSTAAFTASKISYGVPFGANWSVSTYISGSNILTDAGAVNLGANLTRNTVVSVYPGTGTTTTFYLNNNTSAGVPTSGTFTGSLVLRIGANTNDPTAGRTSNCFHELVLLWNRALSFEEIREVKANPYAVFGPKKIHIPASAGGIVTHALTAARAFPRAILNC